MASRLPHPRAWLGLLLLLAGGACGPATEGADEGPVRTLITPTHVHMFDVLFVVDDSPSMAEEAPSLAAAWSGVAEMLEYLDRDGGRHSMSWRVGVVRTSVPGPGCATAEPAGAFVSASCRARPEDFLRPAAGPDGAFDGSPNLFEPGCADVCDLDAVPRLPTATAADPTPRPRPWVEIDRCSSNLPPELTAAEALSCLGPVGVAGCAFESPLEAMARALRRMEDATAPEFGFRRPGASLVVVFVTDELDCSFAAEAEAALDPEGSRALWSDPQADAPTSALCWNGGVSCDPGDAPGTYASCAPIDRRADGTPAAPPAPSVLRPVAGYLDLLLAYRALQRERNPMAEVFVLVVSGRGPNVEPAFADAEDPAFQATFGVGPGCESDTGRALAPVRLTALTEGLPWGRDFPFHARICDPGGLAASLTVLDHSLFSQVTPMCVPPLDPDRPAATLAGRPACRVDLVTPTAEGLRRRELPVCQPTCAGAPCPPSAWDQADDVSVPLGAPACVQWLTDLDGSTPTHVDDMSLECVDVGKPLEYVIRFAPCPLLPSESSVEATCNTLPEPAPEPPSDGPC